MGRRAARVDERVEVGEEVRHLEEATAEGQVVGHDRQAGWAYGGSDRESGGRLLRGGRRGGGGGRRGRRGVGRRGAGRLAGALRGRGALGRCRGSLLSRRSRLAGRRSSARRFPWRGERRRRRHLGGLRGGGRPRGLGELDGVEFDVVLVGYPLKLDQQARRIGVLGNGLAQDDHAMVVLVVAGLRLFGGGDKLLLLRDRGFELGHLVTQLRGLVALGREGQEPEGGDEAEHGDTGEDGEISAPHRTVPGIKVSVASPALSVCSAVESRTRSSCARASATSAGSLSSLTGAASGSGVDAVAAAAVTASKAAIISN